MKKILTIAAAVGALASASIPAGAANKSLGPLLRPHSMSYELGGGTRTMAARQSHSGNLGSGAASREPAEAAPANMGEIDNHAIDIYEKEMRSALSITDRPRQDAAVASARQQLAQNIRKPLTAGTIEELDGLLDLGGVSPELGATA